MDVKAYIESGIIESYVLGIADSVESAELEQLCIQYPEIKQAVDSFEASLEKISLSNATEPFKDVKNKLLISLQNEFIEEPITLTSQKPVRPIYSWVKYAVAASIILLVISSGFNIYFYTQIQSINQKYLALVNDKSSLEANLNIYKTKALDIYNSMQLMSDPVMIKVSMPGIKGKENNLATVFWDKNTKDVYLLANRLPQASPDKQYQLWALDETGKPIDAGLLSDCNGLCKLKNIINAKAFAITLENKGGSPSPHLDQLYVLGNVVI